MKNYCILCKDLDVKEIRNTGTVMGKNVLKIPLSEKGVGTATHWFCFLTATEDGYNQLLKARKEQIESGKYIIEESDERSFLEKWNLKRIQ